MLCCLVNLYKRDYLLSNSSIVIPLALSLCGSRNKAKVTKMSASERHHFIQLHNVIISAQKTELKNNKGIKHGWREDSKWQGALKKMFNLERCSSIFLFLIELSSFLS